MSEAILSVRNLVKRFGKILVTNEISFDLEAGARHALIGPNGAGKSTLVNQLSGVLRSDSGQIVLDGRDVTRTSPRERVTRGLGRTFQIINLFAKLTVFENIFLALSERAGIQQPGLAPGIVAKRANRCRRDARGNLQSFALPQSQGRRDFLR